MRTKQQERSKPKPTRAPRRPTLPTYEVFTEDYSTVMTVPREAIDQLPHKVYNIKRFVLCRNHHRREGDGGQECELGGECRFVHLVKHVQIEDFPSSQVHVSYAWRSAAEVSHPTLLPTAIETTENNSCVPTVPVLFPPAVETDVERIDQVPTDRILLTRGAQCILPLIRLDAEGKPVGTTTAAPPPVLSACPEYHLDRLCKLGKACPHVHVFHLDPTAKPFQRAPCPRYGAKSGKHSPLLTILPIGTADMETPSAETKRSITSLHGGSGGLSTTQLDSMRLSSGDQTQLHTPFLDAKGEIAGGNREASEGWGVSFVSSAPAPTILRIASVDAPSSQEDQPTPPSPPSHTSSPISDWFVWNPYAKVPPPSTFVNELYHDTHVEKYPH